MTPKETLTVEWLPAYNWNTWTESWINTWEEYRKFIKENKLLEQYNFVSYGDETRIKLNELLKVLNEEEMK